MDLQKPLFQISTIPSSTEKQPCVLMISHSGGLDDEVVGAEELETAKDLLDKNGILTIDPWNRPKYLVSPEPESTGDDRMESWRQRGAEIAGLVKKNHHSSLEIDLHNCHREELRALLEGIGLAAYQFDLLRTKDVKAFPLKAISVISDGDLEDLTRETLNVLTATYAARDLVNLPLSHLTAEQLGAFVKGMAESAGASAEVLNKSRIASLKMGGLLSVNKGSIDPPTFTIAEYKPKNAVNKKPVVLVGKGVVYDTGGMSLKPTKSSMDFMKSDMGGAALVASAFYACALNKLPIHLVCLIPASDNRPGQNAYVPGDVITMFDGTTVEVMNTDAEGRLLLADALSYASKYDPELVIDAATLTGAAAAAIGPLGVVSMGTAEDDEFANLEESGYRTYERSARFPFWKEYGDELKSPIADLKNTGGGFAGAITAGKFLENFTSYPWIHLDVAGPTFNQSATGYKPRGGTGFGVRMLYDFLKNRSKA